MKSIHKFLISAVLAMICIAVSFSSAMADEDCTEVTDPNAVEMAE